MSNQVVSPTEGRGVPSGLSRAVKRLRGRPRLALLVGGVAAALLVVVLVALMGGGGESGSQAAVAVVERGPLTIALTEAGTIRAKRNVEIKSEVEGQSTITYIVDEGTLVKKGDLLVSLDSGDLEDRLIQQKMSYEDAKAGYERAKADLDITESRNESNIKKAQQDLEFALMDLEKWLGKEAMAGAAEGSAGSGSPNVSARADPAASKDLLELAGLKLTGREGELFKQRRQAGSDIDLAEGQLRQAQARFESTQELYQRNYASQEELVADRLLRDRRQAELAVAILSQMLQEEYDWPKGLKLRQSAVEETRRELGRVKSEAVANLAQAQAELAKRKAQLDLQQSRLEKIQEQVAKTKITAPQDGLVVYPQAPPWRNQPPMEVGAQVRYRQTLIQLPDLSEIIVETKVYESEVSKVKVGQEARIKVTALAQTGGDGQAPILNGEVTKIAVMPDFQNRWMGTEQRTFTVEVTVVDRQPEVLAKLKPEMSAEVTIVLARLSDALSVPVQAVTRLGEQTVSYRLRGEEAELVPVTVGLTSTTRAQIVAGLSAGDRVLLYPPLSATGGLEALGLPGGEVPEQEAGGSAQGEQEAGGSAQGAEEAVREGSEPKPDLSGLSEEERAAFRRRLKEASPEERRRMLQARRQRAGGGAPGGASAAAAATKGRGARRSGSASPKGE